MNEYLTINEVAAITKRSRQWVYAQVETGAFEVMPSVTKTYISTISVRRWLEEQCVSLEDNLRHYYDQLEETLV